MSEDNQVLPRDVVEGLGQCHRLNGEWKDIRLLDDDWLVDQEGGELSLEKTFLSACVELHEKLFGVVFLPLAE
jgi:hypothetical protein